MKMNIFSDENKQQVLETLFELATDKGNVPAIKLYLDLANDQVPQDALTLERAIDLLRSPSALRGGTEGGSDSEEDQP